MKLQYINTYFKEIFYLAGIGIMTLQKNRSIQFVNLEALKIFGYNSGELEDIKFNNLFHISSQVLIETFLSDVATIHSNKQTPVEFTGIHKDNSAFPVELNTSCITVDEDTVYTIIIRDITESRKNEENLKHQAYFDQLTDIPNRTLFTDRAETALNQAKRSKEGLAIIFIDLDEFKEINDSMGHDAGDIILKNISQRLITSARKSDTVSRRGGDEFTILMPRIKNIKDAAKLAERILKSNKKAIIIDQSSVFPKTSIGISVFPDDGDTIDILIKNADQAMYRSKKSGKNRYSFYKTDV